MLAESRRRATDSRRPFIVFAVGLALAGCATAPDRSPSGVATSASPVVVGSAAPTDRAAASGASRSTPREVAETRQAIATPTRTTRAQAGQDLLATAAAADAARADWRAAGCAACHGLSGGGFLAPAIAAGDMAAADFVASVRREAAGAHGLYASEPSDADLERLWAWLRTPEAGSALPATAVGAAEVFRLEPVASGLAHPVALAWGPAPAGSGRAGEGVLYVATNGAAFPPAGDRSGEVVWLDGATPRPYAAGLERPLGLLFVPSDDGLSLLVSSRGKVSAWRDTDGDGLAEEVRVVVDGLPSADLHQNNSLAQGPDGMVYLGMGTRTNADAAAEDDQSGTILRFAAGGGKVEVFARGLRNPFDLAFDAEGRLFATDNGVDPPVRPDAPEELDLVVAGGFYGHPLVFGTEPPDAAAAALDPIAPIATFPPHASANGLLVYSGAMFPELAGQLVVAEFGSYLDGYEDAGRRIVAAVLRREASGGFRAVVTPLVEAFPGRPLDLLQAPDGAIYVADFDSGVVWRLSRRCG